jgi:hypothetical protein
MEGASPAALAPLPFLYAGLLIAAGLEAGISLASKDLRVRFGLWAAALIAAALLLSFLYNPISGLSLDSLRGGWLWSVLAFGPAWIGLAVFAGSLRYPGRVFRIVGISFIATHPGKPVVVAWHGRGRELRR